VLPSEYNELYSGIPDIVPAPKQPVLCAQDLARFDSELLVMFAVLMLLMTCFALGVVVSSATHVCV
jgi:hypothetical protein